MKFDIKKYPGKYVMHCKTEEEAKDFCNYLDSVGRTWALGNRYPDDVRYDVYKEKTAYAFNTGTWTLVDWYRLDGYTILEWSDFMKKKQFTKSDLKTGDVILRRNGFVEIANCELKMFIEQNGWTDFDDINSDLTHLIGGSDWDIIAVRRPNKKHECRFNAFDKKLGTLVYERNEPEEMTLEQVCKLLGKEIKIVKSK